MKRRAAQVYKALRGGVQDVAVKVLLCNDNEQLAQFEKVRVRRRRLLDDAHGAGWRLSRPPGRLETGGTDGGPGWRRCADRRSGGISPSNNFRLGAGCRPQEIGILKSISYDRNIVQFYGATMVDTEPMLLLEYCEGGDLRCDWPRSLPDPPIA